MDSVSDWSGLVPDLLEEIAKIISTIEDFTAFRGVCTSWRAAATKDKFMPVSKVPLLMLPEKDGDGDVREFYSFCKKKTFLRIPVPEAKGKRCVGAGFGWILTAPTSGEELSLAKPLSSAKIQLPDMKTSPEDDEIAYDGPEIPCGCCCERCCLCLPRREWREYFIKRAVLSANPSETSDYVVTVVVNRRHSGYLWRNGDKHWTKLEGPRNLANVCYHEHNLYAIDWEGNVWMWWDHYLLPQAPAEILVALPHESWVDCLELAYLVESSKGELLLISRRRSRNRHGWEYKYHTTYFEIIKIDVAKRKSSVIKDLDRDVVFIGLNSAVSVDVSDFSGEIKGNHIYFTKDDSRDVNEGKPMGIYNVEDESIEKFNFVAFSSTSPPLWIFPSLIEHPQQRDVVKVFNIGSFTWGCSQWLLSIPSFKNKEHSLFYFFDNCGVFKTTC